MFWSRGRVEATFDVRTLPAFTFMYISHIRSLYVAVFAAPGDVVDDDPTAALAAKPLFNPAAADVVEVSPLYAARRALSVSMSWNRQYMPTFEFNLSSRVFIK